MSEKSKSSSGLSLCSVLFVVFLVLKLTGLIGWSWWWVTAPLWGGFLLATVIVLIALAIAGCIAVFAK